MWFRKSGFCRQNVEWTADGSYLSSGVLCKRRRDLLKGLARKAPAGEAPDPRGSDALAWYQAPCSIELRLEGGDSVGCCIGGDQPPLKVCSDRGIAVPSPREPLRARFGYAGVVE